MRFLIYRAEDQCFADTQTSERVPAANPFPDDLIVVDYGGETALPLWLVPTDVLSDEILNQYEENWSVRLARCRTVKELADAVDTLDVVQAEELFRTLPDELLHAWTGRQFNRDVRRILYELSLERFESRLEERGIPVQPIPVAHGDPLALPNVEPINQRPPSRNGRQVPVDALHLSEAVRTGLRRQGISALYTHQALALEYMRQMREDPVDLVLTTPTASGKTWAFLPGIVEDLLDRGGNALFLYPLRALTIDQEAKIQGFLEATPGHALRLDSFHGSRRLEEIIDPRLGMPDLLVATPDKMNHALHEQDLQALIGELRYIVLDEAHTYRGFFGINAALFLRRLLYFARDDVRLVLSSATLENTIDFARRLTGRTRFRVIGASGAPAHPRYYYLSHNRFRRNGGAHLIALRTLGRTLLDKNKKAVVFVPWRAQAQRLSQAVRVKDLQVSPLISGVGNYNEILEQLRSGEQATLVFSTTTLEAGIDIGDLDYVGIYGFPGSRTSFKQMAGRAGRRGPGHIIFFAGSTPADVYYGVPANLMQLVDDDADPVHVDPTNVFLLEQHLRRLCWEASKARGPMPEPEELVDALLLPGAFSDQETRRRLVERLLPIAQAILTRPDQIPRAPQLRDSSGVQHLVARTGEAGDPRLRANMIALGAESKPDWLIESITDLVAYREWALESVVLRDDTYFKVLDWTRGRFRMKALPWSLEAVFIWVEDVTEKLLPPEEHARQGSPSDKEIQHFHQVSLAITTELSERISSHKAGPLQIESGAGEVAHCLPSHRSVWSKASTFSCPRVKESAGVRPFADDGLPWEIVDATDGRLVKRIEPDDPVRQLWRSSVVLPEGLASERYQEYYRVVDRKRSADRVRVMVEIHRFDQKAGGSCSCGATVDAEHYWKVDREPAPRSWTSHSVFSSVPRALKTVLTNITLSSASGGAALAFFNALVKALPNVLEVEPSDIGYTVAFEGGVATLTVYDSIEGGLGISTRVPEVLPELLHEVRRLLRIGLTCGCEGHGCFGCILPFRSLHMSAEAEAEIRNAIALLEELEPFRIEAAVAAAHALAEETAPHVDQPASIAPADDKSYFRDLLLDLDGVLVHTTRIDDDCRRTGPSDRWLTNSRSYPGVAQTLEHICGLPDVRVAVVTNAPAEYAKTLIRHHLPGVAERLLKNLIAAARKPRPVNIRPWLEGRDPTRALLIGDRREDIFAAQRLGISSALALWGCADAADAADAGPDFLLDKATDLVELLSNGWQRWRQPLEAEGLPAGSRRPPLRIRRHGSVWTVFSRYMPACRARSDTLLGLTAQRVLWFKSTGIGATLIAEYIALHFPGIPVTVIPGRPGHETKGLTVLTEVLREIGHPVIDGLRWRRIPEQRQKEAGGLSARRENVRDAFSVRDRSLSGKTVLLVDDVVTTGATLAEATRTLQEAGARVIPVAIAYTVWDEDGGEYS